MMPSNHQHGIALSFVLLLLSYQTHIHRRGYRRTCCSDVVVPQCCRLHAAGLQYYSQIGESTTWVHAIGSTVVLRHQKTLESDMFVCNPFDVRVFRKTEKGSQMTVLFHVDDSINGA